MALVLYAFCYAINPVAVVIVPAETCDSMIYPVSEAVRKLDNMSISAFCYDVEAIATYDSELCFP